MRLYLFVVSPILSLLLASTSMAQEARILSSVLPLTRSVASDQTATAFATLINASDVTALNCRITPSSFVPASLTYQTTNSTTNGLTGSPNSPVDIPPRASQAFVISFEPSLAFSQSNVELRFECDNAVPAQLRTGVNILRLSASDITDLPPDIIALAATLQSDGFVHFAHETRVGVFAVATSNVGGAGEITVSADNGDAGPPVTYQLCETDPVSGACLAPRTDTITRVFSEGETPSFAVFARPNGFVPRRPAIYRSVVRFTDAVGVERGSTSVALQTDSGSPPENISAILGLPNGNDFEIDGDDVDVAISIDADGFDFGIYGYAQLYVNGFPFQRYDESQTDTVSLGPGNHQLTLRLHDPQGNPSFPDAQSTAQILVRTPLAPSLALDDQHSSLQAFEFALLNSNNIFPESSVYFGTIGEHSVQVLVLPGGGMGLLVPDIREPTGTEILNVEIEGQAYQILMPIVEFVPSNSPRTELEQILAETKSEALEAIDALDPDINEVEISIFANVVRQIEDVESTLDQLNESELQIALALTRNQLEDQTASPNAIRPILPDQTEQECVAKAVFRRGASIVSISLAGIAAIPGRVLSVLVSSFATARIQHENANANVGFQDAVQDCYGTKNVVATFGDELKVEVEDSNSSYQTPSSANNDVLGITNRVPERFRFTAIRQLNRSAITAINQQEALLDQIEPFLAEGTITYYRQQFAALRGPRDELLTSDELAITVSDPNVEISRVTSIGDGQFDIVFTADNPTSFEMTVTDGRDGTPPLIIPMSIEVPPYFDFNFNAAHTIVAGIPQTIELNPTGEYHALNVFSDIAGTLAQIEFAAGTTPGVLSVNVVDGFFGLISVPVQISGPRGVTTEHLTLRVVGFEHPSSEFVSQSGFGEIRCNATLRDFQAGRRIASCDTFIIPGNTNYYYQSVVPAPNSEVLSITNGPRQQPGGRPGFQLEFTAPSSPSGSIPDGPNSYHLREEIVEYITITARSENDPLNREISRQVPVRTIIHWSNLSSSANPDPTGPPQGCNGLAFCTNPPTTEFFLTPGQRLTIDSFGPNLHWLARECSPFPFYGELSAVQSGGRPVAEFAVPHDFIGRESFCVLVEDPTQDEGTRAGTRIDISAVVNSGFTHLLPTIPDQSTIARCGIFPNWPSQIRNAEAFNQDAPEFEPLDARFITYGYYLNFADGRYCFDVPGQVAINAALSSEFSGYILRHQVEFLVQRN